MKCPYEKIQCAYLEKDKTGEVCLSCEHHSLWLQNEWLKQRKSTGDLPDISVKPLKRILFVILVVLNVAVLFFPNTCYWIWTGKDFLANRLNKMYDKWILK